MKILITGPGTFNQCGDETPEVGSKYALEEADTASGEQNRLFHALVQEYFKTGLSSRDAKELHKFRDQVKRDLGAGFEKVIYAVIEDGKAVIKEAGSYGEVPEAVRNDPDLKKMILGKLKSWSDYTKKERTTTIDNLISEMHQVGVQTKHFHEILKGLEK